MTRGYFPDRAIPPINSSSIENAIPDILAYATPRAFEMLQKKKNKNKPVIHRSHVVQHSVPKRKHLRRSLAIPHPLIQTVLSEEIAKAWSYLSAFCEQSPLSLSKPAVSSIRAVESTHGLGEQPSLRAQRSVGARYLLQADIARFYPSIYTHSIPWALHTKAAARADTAYLLVGNRLDLWVRETQDKQTGGIPIGPDTSFVLGETIATAIDLQLMSRFPHLRGTRSIDDYFLYFSTISEAEQCIAALHEIGSDFALDVNDTKTEIVVVPDSLEPLWKSGLRTLIIRDKPHPQAFDLLTLFDRAFEFAKQFPSDNVLTYAAKQVLGAPICFENWVLCEALLLKAALAEPSMLSVLHEIYVAFASFHTDSTSLAVLLNSICEYHAPLQQGNEVSWALWLASQMQVEIATKVADLIVRLDDDLVALAALHLRDQGLFGAGSYGKWESHMTAGELYEQHWLLAYEAHDRGWLPSLDGSDYVGADEFFPILRAHGVRFFGGAITGAASSFMY